MMTDVNVPSVSSPGLPAPMNGAPSTGPTPGAPRVAAPSVAVSAATDQSALPTARRTLNRLLRSWLGGLLLFGYGPALTYGWLVWLLNDEQWRWTTLTYAIEVPLFGGLCLVLISWLRYRPIHRALARWESGAPVDRTECLDVYERLLRLPWVTVTGAGLTALAVYLIGTAIVHRGADQPFVEMIPKTLPAISLMGGMLGAFCYFSTGRALYPATVWCSLRLRDTRPIQHVSLTTKFLATTCVLALAALCLLQPAAYTLGQLTTEQHLTNLNLLQLRVATERLALFEQLDDRIKLLNTAVVGMHGYVFAMTEDGRLVTPHPRGYATVAEERFYKLNSWLKGQQGAWVDRVGVHRAVAFRRLTDPPWICLSVSFPTDFALPLQDFVRLSWLVVLEVLFVVVLFGRYYIKSITTPLAELSQTAQRIAERGDLSLYVPVTTNDELSEVARSFNRMVEELQASKSDLEAYTQQLERSAQELTALTLEMEDLLRVVSHDLRAPLINIQGFSKRLGPIMQETLQLLQRLTAASTSPQARAEAETFQHAAQARLAESTHFISKSVEKMDALLSSLLAISRIGRKADPMRLNDLDGILDDVLATFTHQLSERAVQVIRHPLPKGVPCRRNEINQVFSNLISNAISYMGPTGQRFIEVGGADGPEQVECFIRDTGVGISPEDHERIFHMFTRLEAVAVPGEGIGLAYVRRILRSHGGTIRLISQRGQGSTFFFTLPKIQGQVTGAA